MEYAKMIIHAMSILADRKTDGTYFRYTIKGVGTLLSDVHGNKGFVFPGGHLCNLYCSKTKSYYDPMHPVFIDKTHHTKTEDILKFFDEVKWKFIGVNYYQVRDYGQEKTIHCLLNGEIVWCGVLDVAHDTFVLVGISETQFNRVMDSLKKRTPEVVFKNLEERIRKGNEAHTLTLVTVEGTTYIMDMKTGKGMKKNPENVVSFINSSLNDWVER